jgi:hypothetical protein
LPQPTRNLFAKCIAIIPAWGGRIEPGVENKLGLVPPSLVASDLDMHGSHPARTNRSILAGRQVSGIAPPSTFIHRNPTAEFSEIFGTYQF